MAKQFGEVAPKQLIGIPLAKGMEITICRVHFGTFKFNKELRPNVIIYGESEEDTFTTSSEVVIEQLKDSLEEHGTYDKVMDLWYYPEPITAKVEEKTSKNNMPYLQLV